MKNTAQQLAGIYCYLVPFGHSPNDPIEKSKICLVQIHEAEELINAAGYMLLFTPIAGNYHDCFDKPVVFTSKGGRGQIGYRYATQLLEQQKTSPFLKKFTLGMKLAEVVDEKA